jgi:hypothetical protein
MTPAFSHCLQPTVPPSPTEAKFVENMFVVGERGKGELMLAAASILRVR